MKWGFSDGNEERGVTATNHSIVGHRFVIEPILRRLTSLVTSGFTKREAHELASRIAAQPMQTEQVYSYRVVRTGTHALLRIVVWKDDPDACDVFFFAPTDLTTAGPTSE